MAGKKGYKPSYRLSIKGWLGSKIGKPRTSGLKHPIRTTRKVRQYLRGKALKKYGTGVMGGRAHAYEKARKYFGQKKGK